MNHETPTQVLCHLGIVIGITIIVVCLCIGTAMEMNKDYQEWRRNNDL